MRDFQKEEHERVERLRKARKASVATTRVSVDKRLGQRRFRGEGMRFNTFAGKLGIRDSIVAGELLIRKLKAIETARAYQAERPGVVHVKDGKPLTAHGAKLLGLPWTGGGE